MTEGVPTPIQLKRAREQRGWTQEELAKQMMSLLEQTETMSSIVDPKTISRWERAKETPRPYYRILLAKLLGIPIEAWLSQEDHHLALQEEQFSSRSLHEAEQPYPTIWTIPFKLPPFVGRQDILEHLHEALLEGKTTALTQAISGLGGIGKTLTAARYAYLHRSEYQAVCWIEAESRQSFINGLLKMARDLNLPEKRLKAPERVLAAVRQWMKDHTYWLLILDNIEDFALVSELLPSSRRGHVILTTRISPTLQSISSIELPGLSEEEGALLLLQRAGRLQEMTPLEQADDEERQLAMHLSFQMEGLPLALEQAGSYIQEQQCSLLEYLEWYKTRRAYLLSWRSRKQQEDRFAYPYSVATTWSLSFEKIRQESPAAVDLLSFYAFLDSQAIPDTLPISGARILGPQLEHISNVLTLLEVLASLRRYSFVRRDSDQHVVNIHRLVQVVFRDQMDEETQKRWAERAVRVMSTVFFEAKGQPLQEQDVYFPHAQACSSWIKEWSFRFREAPQLLVRLGDYAQQRSFYPLAEEFLRQAIVIIEEIRGPGHVERAVAYNNLATLYEEMGDYRLAEDYLLRAVPILEKGSIPEMKTLLAHAYNNLAGVQEKLKKLSEAEQSILRALEIIRQVKNAKSQDIGLFLNTYAVILSCSGRNEEAKSISQRVYSMFPPEQRSTLEQAHLLETQGEREVPIRTDLLEQAIKLYQQVYGAQHYTIAHCLSAIGAGYFERGDYPRAKHYAQQALEMYKHLHLDEHSDVVVILVQLTQCALVFHEVKEASEWFKQAQSLAEKNPSPYVSKRVMDSLDEIIKMSLPKNEGL